MRTRVISIFLALLALASCTQPVVEVFGSISGCVVNEDTGAAIGGAKVTITPTGSSQVTSTDGEFLFDNLDAQEYTISIKKDGFEDMSQKVSVKAGVSSSVQVALSPVQPVLSVDPATLDFGDEDTSLALDITNSGKGTLEWIIEEEIEWLTCSVISGTTTDKVSSVVVKVSREGMEKGSYSETIVVSSNGGSKIVKVKMSVGSTIKLSVEPDELDFGAVVAEKEIVITNNGPSAIEYTASSANDWLTLSKSSASVTKTDYIHAIVSREGLSAGSYTSSITISTKGGDIVIPVKMEVAAKSAPTVTLEDITDITYSSATGNGTIVSVGSSKVFRYGFCVSDENKQPTVDDKVFNLGDCAEPKSFSGTVNNIESMTTYYIRAFAENQEGVAYSSVKQFTTSDLPKIPEVATGEVSDVTSNTAVVGGSVSNLGNVSKLKAHGHVWNTTGSPTLQNDESTDLGELSTTTTFSSTLEDLEPGTKYYVKAYATNEKGTAYGSELTFTTGVGDVVLETMEATSVTHESAVVEGEIISDGKNEILEKGMCYATYPEPDRYDDRVVAEEGFKCTLTGLMKATTYYARAYVKTAQGKYFYGNDITFTTTEFVSTPTVVTGDVEELTHESATVIGQIVSTGGATVTEYGHVLGDGSMSDVDLNTAISVKRYTAETDSPLEYTSVFEDLPEYTHYWVRAFATNAKGTVYGDAVSFTTKVEPVVLSDVSIMEVTKNSAYLSAQVLSTNGHTQLDERGFAYAKYGTEDYTFVPCGSDFTLNLTGLESETEYEVAAYVETSEGLFYSSDFNYFTTLAAPVNPTNGLYAYYTFEDNTTNTVSGAPNGSGINTTYVDGIQGSKAIKFSSANSKLNVPEAMIDGDIYTISFWASGMGDGHIFSCTSSASWLDFTQVLYMKDGFLKYARWWTYSSGLDSLPSFTHSSFSSEWCLITITANKKNLKLYINGEYIDNISIGQDDGAMNTGLKFVFGGNLDAKTTGPDLGWASMSIDNLRIYNSRVLTAEEVKQIYEYEK